VRTATCKACGEPGALLNPAETLYTRTADGLHIAYQVVGSGPIDIVYVPNWASPVDLMWDEPRYARFLSRSWDPAEQDADIDMIEEFLTGGRPPRWRASAGGS
jgi:hypothetical protein